MQQEDYNIYVGLSREFNKYLSYQVLDRIQRTLIYEESTSSLSEELIISFISIYFNPCLQI